MFSSHVNKISQQKLVRSIRPILTKWIRYIHWEMRKISQILEKVYYNKIMKDQGWGEKMNTKWRMASELSILRPQVTSKHSRSWSNLQWQFGFHHLLKKQNLFLDSKFWRDSLNYRYSVHRQNVWVQISILL